MSRFQNAEDEIAFLNTINIPELYIDEVIKYNNKINASKKNSAELFTDFKFINDAENIPVLDVEKDIIEFAFYNTSIYQTVTVTPNQSFVNGASQEILNGMVTPNQYVNKLIKIIEKRIKSHCSLYPKTVLSMMQNDKDFMFWSFNKFIFECIRNNALLISDVIDVENIFIQQIDDKQTLILACDYLDDEKFKSIMLELHRPSHRHLYLPKFKNKLNLIQEHAINTTLHRSEPIPFLILEDFQWEFIKLKRFT